MNEKSHPRSKMNADCGTGCGTERAASPYDTDSQLTVAQTFRNIVTTLAQKYGEGEARAMARFIFENLKGWTPVDLAIRANEHPSLFMEGKIDGVMKRLLDDEPIQYIFGTADFYGMKLRVTPATLIPRPETAELVDFIVKESGGIKDLRVLDLGTGTGCIAIALARNLPFAQVTAVDISNDALAVAEGNVRALHARIEFVDADILSMPHNAPAALTGPYDIIVSNPPYIAQSERKDMEPNVLLHEPATALFVPDNDPLEFYDAALEYAAGGALASGGVIWFEINPLFAAGMIALCHKHGFGNATLLRDTSGKERFVRASVH